MTPSSEEAAPFGPLAGCKVLELGSIVAGPYCGRLLADHGADVIKLEAPGGDRLRNLGHHFQGKSLFWASIHRNKRIISVDLKAPEGQDIIRRLMVQSDIVVENLSPGTLEKFGLGYEAISKDNPGLVMVRISGYGQTGPYADRPGYGVIGEAMSGLRSIIGDPDRPPPRAAVPLTDYITGVHAAYGAMAALFHRERTGQGQVVDTALYESAFSFMENFVPAFDKLGVVPERTGPKLPGSAPNNLYPTKDGKYIHITASNDSIFVRLLGAMGRSELAEDAEFGDDTWRRSNEDTVDDLVAEWTIQHDITELDGILREHAVPSAPIYTIEDVFADPHVQARDMLVETPDAEVGPLTLAGIVPKMTKTPGELRWAGRACGADTRDVLGSDLGMSEDEIDRLQSESVIVCADSRRE